MTTSPARNPVPVSRRDGRASHATAWKGWPRTSRPDPRSAGTPSTDTTPSTAARSGEGCTNSPRTIPRIPGIVGDQGEGIETAIVGIAVVDDFDRRADRIDRGGDFFERELVLVEQKVAADAYRDLEFQADPPVC